MARTLASLTFLACVLSLANGNGMCQGAAECDSVDDTSSALLQLQQAVPRGRLEQQEGLQRRADEPMPKLKCTYYDGACWARKTACNLTEEMKQWDVSGAKHSNISWLTDKLRDLCFNNVSNKTAGGTAAGVAEPFHLNCFNGRYNACPGTNEGIVEYLEKHPGAKYATEAGKAASMTILSWTRLLLTNAGELGLGGQLSFAFLGSMLSTFFPSSGGLPTNPCTNAAAKNWGKCVWEQVKPFVEHYIRGEISNAFQDIWKDKLKGYQDSLQTAHNEARADSIIENGTVVNITDQAREDMDEWIKYLDHTMTDDASFFQDKEGDYAAEAVYLSMFSSLHVSVMTSMLGSEKFHTRGHRFHTQRYTLCYARKVLQRALRAHNLRMSLVLKKPQRWYCVDCHSSDWTGDYYWKCCGERVIYEDRSSGCSWNEVCEAQCSSSTNDCHHTTPCDKSGQENAYGCHRAWVQKQSEAMWLHWLAPIPTWIETMMKMQELKLKNVDNSRARRHKRRVRRWGRGRFVEERDGHGSFADCDI